MYCQKCRSPLKADKSLDNLNPAAFDLLVGSVTKSPRKPVNSNASYPQERNELYNRTIEHGSSPLYKRRIPGPSRSSGTTQNGNPSQGNPTMSFVEITESQIVVPESLQYDRELQAVEKDDIEAASLPGHLMQHERLYSILSSHSDIDHPICVECSSMLIAQLNTRLAAATRERDAYASFLKQIQAAPAEDLSKIKEEKKNLKRQEEQTIQELLELENEKEKLEAELMELEEQNHELDRDERQFWASGNVFEDALYEIETELSSLQQKYAHDQKQLERLQRTNVYNDTFCIGHDGYFGTINGLRLGRLPSQNVEWAEINAAWGQALLLLAIIAERLNYTFRGYKLRPLGSTSRIEKLEYPHQAPEPRQRNVATPSAKVTPLDLFSSGDMPLGRVFNHRKFDAGMVAFLECLAQLGNHVETTSKLGPRSDLSGGQHSNPMVMPYSIEGDKIDGVSIRLGVGFSQDENFTKACKFALTCCKFLLAHVSNMDGAKVT